MHLKLSSSEVEFLFFHQSHKYSEDVFLSFPTVTVEQQKESSVRESKERVSLYRQQAHLFDAMQPGWLDGKRVG